MRAEQATQLPELWLEKADSYFNAIICQKTGDDFNFKMFGSGTIKQQNDVGSAIVTACNNYPAVKAALERIIQTDDEASKSDWELITFIRQTARTALGLGER